MISFAEVQEKLYRLEFSPTDEQAKRFLAFDPSLRYLKGFQGEIIRNSIGHEDPVSRQMVNTFFPDLEFQEARQKIITAINYGSRKMNEFFHQSFGEATVPFQLREMEDTNLTAMLKEAQARYEEAFPSGSQPMIRRDRTIKPMSTPLGYPSRFHDYQKIAEAFRIVRSIGIGYNMLKIIQSSEFVLHEAHHDQLVEWVRDCLGTSWSGEAFAYERVGSDFQARRKEVMSVLSKMACRGYNMGTIKDLTGVRFVLKNRFRVSEFLRSATEKVRGASHMEGFDRTIDRAPGDDQYYDPRFDCDKFILRPSIPYVSEEKSFSNLPELNYIIGRKRIRLPVEVQVMTEDAVKRMNEDLEQKPAHELYKYRKALAFWQIVNPWSIFGPLMVQNQNFLNGG